MFKINRLDHLVLTVKNIDRTVEFYEKLGMTKEIFKETRVALVDLVYYIEKYCFIVDENLNNILEYLKSVHIEIEEGIVERTGAIGKIISIYLRDPDNNLIELSNYINED